MKIIKNNSDGTLNILNPDKFYIVKTVWRDFVRVNYFIIIKTNGFYGFVTHHLSTKRITLPIYDIHKDMQRAFEEWRSDMPTDHRYVGTLYQFDNEQEFIKAHEEGML